MLIRRIPLRAPEGSEGGAATATVDTAATAATTTSADAGANKNEPLLNFKEVVELRKETRETRDLLKQLLAAQGGRPEPKAAEATTAPAKPTQGAAADAGIAERIAGLERTAALNGVYADLGIKPGPQRDFIAESTKGMPAESVRTFVDAYLKTLPAPTTAGAITATVTTNPVTPPVATGAASTAAKIDPGDLSSIDPEVLKSLPLEERMKRYEQIRSGGPNSNPYAGARTRQLIKLGRK